MDLALLLQAVFLLIVLLCALSTVAIAGWSAWSRRRAGATGRAGTTKPRSAVEEAEISRMRVAIGRRDAQAPRRR